MADNVNAGSNDGLGPKFATDDDGTSHWPYAKLAFGADNTQTKVDGSNPLPVTGAVTVSGVATSAKQDTQTTHLATLAGAVAGTEVQADILTLPALPAGNNNIGDVDIASIAAGNNNIGDVDVASVPTDPFGANADAASATGSISAKLRFIAATGIPITSVPSHAVTNAGVFAVQVDGNALTALQLLDDTVFADDAAFTIGTSKVTVAGGAVVAHGAPDAADAGDAGAPLMNRHRVLFTQGGHPNVKSAVYNCTGSTTDDNIMAAIAGGTKYAVTRITITLDQACTVGVAVRIGFGTANVPALGAANADAVDDVLFYHPGMVPGSMHTVGDGSGLLGVGADGAELRITAGAATGGTLGVVVTYYPIES
jgi:hypothetical protein